MSSTNSDVLAFRCQQCDKRLKAPRRLAGKKVQCPRCSHRVEVPTRSLAPDSAPDSAPAARAESEASPPAKVQRPSPPQRKTSLLDSDDPFQLNAPAIEDLSQRDQSAQEIRGEKAKKREIERQKAAARRKQREAPEPFHPQSVQPVAKATSGGNRVAKAVADDRIPFDSDEELPTNAQRRPVEGAAGAEPAPVPPRAAGAADKATSAESGADAPKRSVFDDDLPELEALTEEPTRRVSLPPMESHDASDLEARPRRSGASGSSRKNRTRSNGQAPAGRRTPPKAARPPAPEDDLADLGDLLPELSNARPLKPLHEEEVLENAHYRVVCSTCGTAQYVTPSAQGMKIKCPDCFELFKAPPPPKDWKPKPMPKLDPDADMALVSQDGLADASDNANRRERTQEILDKAAAEISEEEQENRYDYDFDTAGFVQRTFGFLRDPLTLVQMVGYGCVFACLFWIAQFGANDTDSQFGRGLLLVTVVVLPLVGFLFALPMLSGGLGLIEAVANKQKYVREIPAFNIFDNFADVLVIAVALAISMMPGFLVGLFLSSDANGLYMKVGGVMASTFLLFPILLLSMLDNGSFFPFSGAILRSLVEAAESWASYYLKTLVACFGTLVLWFMLLGGMPALAAVAGFTLPALVFFICQQIGGLADAIGDHLSFEFVPPKQDGEDEDDGREHLE